MTAFVIDFTAEKRAREAEALRDKARHQLRLVAGIAVDRILDGLPGAAEARAIFDKAMDEQEPHNG